jgi:hypothetical protein
MRLLGEESKPIGLGTIIPDYGSSYSGGRCQEDCGLRTA